MLACKERKQVGVERPDGQREGELQEGERDHETSEYGPLCCLQSEKGARPPFPTRHGKCSRKHGRCILAKVNLGPHTDNAET